VGGLTVTVVGIKPMKSIRPYYALFRHSHLCDSYTVRGVHEEKRATAFYA